MSDIVEPDGELWTWVVRSGARAKDAIWPPDSETAAWDLATAWSESAKALRDAVQLSDSAAAELRKAWTDAAGFELYYAVHSLNNGSLGEPGVKEMAVAMDSLSVACRDYGNLIVKAKHEIRRNISENGELFDRCTSWAARMVFAIQVAQQLATLVAGFAGQVGKPAGADSKPPKKPKPQGFWGNVGAFFVGIGEGAVEMAVGFAALAGYGDGHFSWSTFGEAWKGLGKFGLAAATYTVPGLSTIDQTVGLPGFDRGEMGHTLVEAGKAMVAWDTWSEDPSRAAGKTTFNIASAVLGTKGAGAAIRGAGAAAAGSKVGAVAAAGRVVEHAGSAITKIPTGTELAAKAVRKIPGVDTLLSKAGLVHSPSGVPGHAVDTPPPPHNPPGGHTPDERPPTNPPGDSTPEGPPPERPPNRPPDEKAPNHVPEEQRPNRPPEERSPRPGSVGETLGQGGHPVSGKDTPHAGTEQSAPPAKTNDGEPPAARNPEAAVHPAREVDQPKASINPATQEVRMSDRIDAGDLRESMGSKNDEIVRMAQEQWAESNPVQPGTPTQTVIYTVARMAGLVHAAENIVTGHHSTPGSPPPPIPSPKDHTPSPRETAPKDKAPEEKSTSDSLPPGDPGLPPKSGENYVAHVDLEAGKVNRVDPPEPASVGPTPRVAGAEVPSAPPRQATRTHHSNVGNTAGEPAPRRPGSRMPIDGSQWEQRARRPEIPMRGGDHPHHPQPSRAPDEGVPPATDIHSAINPESAPAHADHPPYDDVPEPRTFSRDAPEHNERFADWNRPDDSAFSGPRERPDGHNPIDSPRVIEDVTPRTRNSKLDAEGVPQALRGEKPLAANAEYNVRYENGAGSRFFTDADGKVTHVEATPGTQKPFHNPDLRYPLLPNTQYRVANFHDPNKAWTFEVGEHGKPVAMTGDPAFRGGNDNYRDSTSQLRSGHEGKAAFADHPEYADAYSDVDWAGGHLAAHEMGGPGEYINMHPQMAASNSGNYRDGWVHAASWRAQEAELGKFAARPGQEIENFQVRTEGNSNGIPENVTMRWQETVYRVDDAGEIIPGPDGKPIELSRVTKQRDFPNDPANVNYGP